MIPFTNCLYCPQYSHAQLGNSCIFTNHESIKLILVSQISRGCEITYNGSKHIVYKFSLMFASIGSDRIVYYPDKWSI